jgi:hypothetical protein
MGIDVAMYGGPKDGEETEVIPVESGKPLDVITYIDEQSKEHYYVNTGERSEKGFLKYKYRGYKYACCKL